MTVFVGTSGWQYRDWRGAFYPKQLPQRAWLSYYSERFQVVEVNSTFYNLPEADVFESWRKSTPDDFVFVLKMSRYLTHMKKLMEPREPVRNFLKAAGSLKEKLGPVLVQLPPHWRANPERLREALRSFPKDIRIAVEFRDQSWYVDAVREVLSERNAALCLADRDEKLITPEWRTADWGYARLHWGAGGPHPCYTDARLRDWAQRIRDLWPKSNDVYIFFNNDPGACAVNDARRLAEMLREAGVQTTRVPSAGEIAIAV